MSVSKIHRVDKSKPSKLVDYIMLIKLRLSLLVVFTSMLAFVVAANGSYTWTALGLFFLGGMLVTASANTLNQVLEKDYDKNMARTSNRPVTTGRMSSSEAILFGGITCVSGIVILALFNPLTSFLGMLSFLLYAFVYTPLKRYSTLAVSIGAIPGALPVLIGCTAAEGSITMLGLSLFAIQFLWQFPHFWSIGFLAFEDYKKAGYKLVPESDGKVDRNIGISSGGYTILLFPIVIAMYLTSYISVTSLVISLFLTTIYLYFSINFHFKFNRRAALQLMFSSFFYLPLLLITYLIF